MLAVSSESQDVDGNTCHRSYNIPYHALSDKLFKASNPVARGQNYINHLSCSTPCLS
jgi:hypothetical protein